MERIVKDQPVFIFTRLQSLDAELASQLTNHLKSPGMSGRPPARLLLEMYVIVQQQSFDTMICCLKAL